MHCAGFNSDTYDRYVLGLLEEPDRSQLEAQIQEQCPACLTGVQRSMNLWLVFAETLENAEPSEDFRGRIVRIAELSRKVLTFPKISAVQERPSVPITTLIIICAVTCALLLATWYASRAWTRIDRPNTTPDIESLAQQLATSRLTVERLEEQVRTQKPEPDAGAAAQKSKAQEDQLSKAQAELERYKHQPDLLATLQVPGSRVFPLRPSETAGKAVGYAILTKGPKPSLVFVVSNLPEPGENNTYEFWIRRGEGEEDVPAGFRDPNIKGDTLVLHYDDATLLKDMTGVLVTLEPIHGDYQKPTGPKLLEAKVPAEPKPVEPPPAPAATEEKN